MSLVVRTVSEQVYQTVRDQIVDGSLAPGMPVRQDVLAANLGVSKIPLREALNRLEQDGLVTSIAHRGYVVLALSPQEAEEIFALRLKLEPDAAAEAALRASPKEQARTKAALAALKSATPATSGALNREFHMALIRPCGGLITSQIIERLHIRGERYVAAHLQPRGRGARAQAEHRRLLRVWLARDAKAIAQEAAAHIAATIADLRREFSAGRRDAA